MKKLIEKKKIKENINRDRFKRVAARRVEEILNKLRLLRNCANIGNYSYNEEDKRRIFSTIENSWKNVKSEFNQGENKKEKFSFN
tara:strand:+ start:386 stop:640 length:255 start_codon:yes stop_codon:yes gene_type:complete